MLLPFDLLLAIASASLFAVGLPLVAMPPDERQAPSKQERPSGSKKNRGRARRFMPPV